MHLQNILNGWAWRCTPESIKNCEITWPAVLETVGAVIVYWAVAWRWHTHIHLLVSVCIAPLLLLRSRQSVALGKKWLRHWHDQDTEKYHWRTWRGKALIGGMAIIAGLVSYFLMPLLMETFAKLSARANCGVVRYSEARLSR